MNPSDPMRRLVIVYPKAIGDFLFILPALHTLRRALPDAHITLVAKRKQFPLVRPQEGILFDETFAIGGTTGWRAARRRLNALNPDTIVDMAGNDSSGMLLSFQGGRRLRPHPVDCKGCCALYSPLADSLPRQAPGLHRVEELLAYARHLTGAEPVYSFGMVLPDPAIEASEKMIEKYRLRSGSVVALNIGASRASKRWPAAYFKSLASGLIHRGHRVVMTGAMEFGADGNYDRTVAARFSEQGLFDGEHCINLVTEGGLPPDLQLQRDTHFLRYSKAPRIVVGNDTGPMQIAGSVGVDARRKTVSIFGPTSWRRYAPFDPSRRFPDRPAGDWNRVLFAETECRPAGTAEACGNYRRTCRTPTCMRALSPDSVLQAVLEHLASA